jgi:hypothetical protein
MLRIDWPRQRITDLLEAGKWRLVGQIANATVWRSPSGS